MNSTNIAKLPLQLSQQEVYYDQITNPKSPHYNVGGYAILKGQLHLEHFRKAIESLPQAFDVFDMQFDFMGEQPQCYFTLDKSPIDFPLLDLSQEADPRQAAQQWIQAQFNQAFDLAAGMPLYQIALLKISPQEHWWFSRFHHLMIDGLGYPIFAQHVASVYNGLLANQSIEFDYPLYQDSIDDSTTYVSSASYTKDANYWHQQFAQVPPLLLDKRNGNTNEEASGAIKITISPEQRQQLTELAEHYRTGVQQLTLAALAVYFGQAYQRDRLAFGTFTHNRRNKKQRRTLGTFFGALPFQTTYEPQQTVTEFIQQVKSQQRADYRHQSYPISHLNRHLKLMSQGRSQVFDVLVNYQLLKFDLDFNQLSTELRYMSSNEETVPLHVIWCDYGTQQPWVLEIDYQQAYFSEQEAQLLAQRLLFILDQFAQQADQTLANIDIVPIAEKQLVWQGFNATEALHYPQQKTVIDLLEEQVAKTPQKVAIVFENEQLTYQALHEQSNQLAHYLRKQGVKEETLVAICLERSLDMMVGLWGILKAGAAYVPIDPTYPTERIAYQLADTAAPLLLTTSHFTNLFAQYSGKVLALDALAKTLHQEPRQQPTNQVQPHHLMYVIYTSGSTGKPKGVMNQHDGVLNRLWWAQSHYQMEANDCVLQKTTFCFDVSVWELFWASLVGAKLILARPEGHKDSFYLKQIIEQHHISFMHFVPPMLATFVEVLQAGECPSLRKVLCSGEALLPSHVQAFQRKLPHVQLHNLYGPTEAAIDVTYWEVPQGQSVDLVPIGAPVANTQLAVLDTHQKPTPIGVMGELYIGGVQVARGYLNRPELTAERFVSLSLNGKTSRWYKTGDLVRWLPNGNLEYLGRNDHQVKLRGFRIELGEIETILQTAPKVKQGVVLVQKDAGGQPLLVAYVVAAEGVNIGVIKQFLATQLPEYMVPSVVQLLDELPLTSNGKVDRKALLAQHKITAQSKEYIAPRNANEQLVADIWAARLQIDKVGVHDNFFELGGHSLLANRVLFDLKTALGTPLSIKELFVYKTVEALAAYLDEQVVKTSHTLPLLSVVEPVSSQYPLSFNQERLAFIDQLEGSVHYHMPLVLRLSGKLDKQVLLQAFGILVKRHEVLRTVLTEEGGGLYQKVLPSEVWQWEEYQVDELAPEDIIHRPFDLYQDPMLRVALLQETPDQYLLVLVLHHIAGDGWSVPLMMHELSELYQAGLTGELASLPDLPVQYRHYALWQRTQLTDQVLASSLAYWQQQLAEASPLSLPVDQLAQVPEHAGKTLTFHLNATLSQQLHQLAQQHDCTLFMVLLAGFKALLYRYTGQQDIVVGSPIANRSELQLENLVGFFVNTLALRDQVLPYQAFEQLLQSVKNTALDAYKHQAAPYEKVVEKLGQGGQHHLLNVMFVLQNIAAIDQVEWNGLHLQVIPHENHTAKFDLTFDLAEGVEGIRVAIEYRTQLFAKTTIAQMFKHYERLLQAVVAQPSQSIVDLPMAEAHELQQLQSTFNQTEATYPANQSVHALFEAQVAQHPEAIALIFGGSQYTYEQLNQQANQWAHYLQTQGIGTGDLVALCMERSPSVIVCLLGILKTGAAYVPVDPAYPQNRIDYILNDTQTSLVLTDQVTQAKLAYLDNLRVFAELEAAVTQQPTHNPLVPIEATALAYIMYTSGSTGDPKGVMIEHRSIARLIFNPSFDFLNESARLFLFAPVAFDAATFEIWGALLKGGQLVVSNAELSSLATLADDIRAAQVNVLWLTAGLFHQAVDARIELFAPLRYILAGGDSIHPAAVKKLLEAYPHLTFINGYGPTESTTFAVVKRIDSPEEVSLEYNLIGQPIGNTKAYVVYPGTTTLTPVGITGELCLAGTGLAKGYRNAPELTKQKFVTNPYAQGDYDRLYRTGDLARWLKNGEIEFISRLDSQVKINGYRIEIGEVEHALKNAPCVKQSLVMVYQNEVKKYLVAYIIPDEGCEKTEIQQYLHTQLPDYMVPRVWITLEEFPLTPNGKIDRRALPEPAEVNPQEYIAPRNATEQQLAEVWAELLNVEQVGIYHNFFELGGHSLLAMRVLSRTQEVTGKTLSLKHFLANPTIAQIADLLHESAPNELTIAPAKPDPANRYVPFPLSDVQQAYFMGRQGIFDLGNVGTHIYIEWAYPALDVKRLNEALNLVISRHNMLRMVINDEGEQYILPEGLRYEIAYNDWSQSADATEQLQQIRQALSHQVFSGKEWPLFHLQVSQTQPNEFILHFSIDALVLDTGSLQILSTELSHFYEQPDAPLPALSFTFRDYMLAEQAMRETAIFAQAKAYWVQRLPDFPLAPELPLNLNPSQIKEPQFERREAVLSAELWAALQQKARQAGLTPTSLLLTCFGKILAIWSKKSHFTLNLTLFNRLPFHNDVARILGDFTSLTLLEMDFRQAQPIGDQAKQIQAQLWEDLEHRYFSGVEVQRALSRQAGGTVVLPIVFTSTLGVDNPAEASELVKTGKQVYGITQTSQVWLDHKVVEQAGALHFEWDSVKDLFPAAMLDDMFAAYESLLHQLAQDDASWQQTSWNLLPAYQLERIAAVNATQKTFAETPLLHQLFEQQAQLQPDAMAVKSYSQNLTYGELWQRSNALATELRQAGAQPNELVAIVMEKSWEQVVACLGILMAGAAYLPIDAHFPEERIHQLLEIGEAKVAVTTPVFAERLDFPDKVQVFVVGEDYTAQPALPVVQQAHDIAYVIFTSGSTGVPKGVVIDHQGAVNTILDINERLEVSKNDKVLALAALNFDLSVYDVFGVLGIGGTLVMPRAHETKDPEAWLNYVREEQITLWNTVPMLMQMLVEYSENQGACLDSLRLVMMSGDWIPVNLPDRIKALANEVTLMSLGGATEASIWSIFYPIEQVGSDWTSIPYGKPMYNQEFYVLKPDLSHAPDWVTGDLYIGGIGLAKAYWKDAQKTAASFITHPVTGERLYKTGDLGRYLPNGNIEFLGREDFQVKIQGHRIELGEIEAQLMSHEQVQEAVVLAVDAGSNTKQLVAYLVAKNNLASNDGETVMTDPNERLAFKLEQNAVRQWQNARTITLPLSESDEIHLAKAWRVASKPVANDKEISLAELGQALAGLRQKQINAHPLPRYYYPSAGSLYPVQTYLHVPQGKVTGLDAGYYYYHPQHQLVKLANEEQPQGNLQIFLVADLAAIEPMYGALAVDFAAMEAGYLGYLLQQQCSSLRVQTSSMAAIDNAQLAHALGLHQDQILLQTLDAVAVADAPQVSQRLTIDYATRKSYRLFDETMMPLPWLKVDLPEGSFTYYLAVKHQALQGFEAGVYCYEGELKQWQPVTNLSNQDFVALHQPSNQAIAQTAAFALFLVQSNKDKPSPQDFYQAGALGQWLSIMAAQQSLGVCPIGLINETEVASALKLEQAQVIHSFLGGGISQAQAEALVADAPQTMGDPVQAMRDFVGQKLPAYMVPSSIILLDKIPVTNNGKVDKKSLMKLATNLSTPQEHVAPRNATEQQLATIWQHLLDIDTPGIHDSFFVLGGNSLMAVRLVAAIKQATGIDLSIRAVFTQGTTIAKQAVLLQENQPTNYPSQAEANSVAPQHPNRVPLSFSQESLWFIDQLHGSVPYHVPIRLALQGEVDIAALEQALRTIVQRHEVLRTVYESDNGQAYQVVQPAKGWAMKQTNISESALEQTIEGLMRQPFDLAKDYVLRAHLLSQSPSQYTLFIIVHHIAADGWSIALLIQELKALYEAIIGQQTPVLPTLSLQYADYAIAQQQDLGIERQLDYWQTKLEGVEPLNLPTDYVRPQQHSHRGNTLHFKLDRAISSALQTLANREGGTLFMALLAGFKVLMHRYTGQTDVCVGTPVANRMQPNLEPLIGFFVNSIALRSTLSPQASFSDLLEQIKHTTLEAFEHQQAPFEKVVNRVVKEREANRNPLFQVAFILQNTENISSIELGGLTALVQQVAHHTAKFDLTFEVYPTSNGLDINIEYSTDLFAQATIERLFGHYQQLLQSAIAQPTQAIGQLQMLSAAEQHQILHEFNNHTATYPAELTIVDLIEAQVARTPHHVAVVFENEQLTYAQLNTKANQLAHYLRKQGVKEETLVAICLERSLDMMVGLWGILKAGAAYVPIDPEYPAERIQYILKDTSAPLLLTTRAFLSVFERIAHPDLVVLDDMQAILKQMPQTNPKALITCANLAYIIYTSGSTGKPKGVMTQHSGIVNRLWWGQDYFQLTTEDAILQKTTFCFDVSVWELFWAALVGAKLVLARPNGHKDSAYIKQVIEDEKITISHFVPSMLGIFVESIPVESCPSLRKVLCSGEALLPDQVSAFQQKLPDVPLYNLYGPTEAAIEVTYWKAPQNQAVDLVPIGAPVANTQLLVLSPENQLLPVGIFGELYIGGVQVSRGYLNHPQLTAERFIELSLNGATKRWYKTGDLVRWLPNGDLEYLGRNDDQVKIRGYRIELGEVETALQQHTSVQRAIVLPKNEQLIAYVLPEGDFDQWTLKTQLEALLPAYMVPAFWVAMDQLPLTSNGKVDKKQLLQMDVQTSQAAYVAPRNATEQELATLWGDLLGLEQVSIEANFFELGGHSLAAVRLMAGIATTFGLQLPLVTLFNHPTIKALAAKIEVRHEADATTQILIQLHQGKAEQTPIFGAPGAGGSPFIYYDLAKQLDLPFYAFQAHGADGQDTPLPTVEAMASAYIDELRQVQPQGAYRLAGYSFGGRVAYEMARQLVAAGEEVSQLMILDAFAPTAPLYPAFAKLSQGQQLLLAAKAFADFYQQKLSLPTGQAEDTKALYAHIQSLGIDVTFDQFKGFCQVYASNLSSNYVVAPEAELSVPITVFVTQELIQSAGAVGQQPDLGWQALTTGKVTVHQVAGTHYTFLHAPYVQQVYELILLNNGG